MKEQNYNEALLQTALSEIASGSMTVGKAAAAVWCTQGDFAQTNTVRSALQAWIWQLGSSDTCKGKPHSSGKLKYSITNICIIDTCFGYEVLSK